MSKVAKISIALPAEMAGTVQDAVDSGEYANPSEVVCDALRDWELKRQVETMDAEEVRRLVQEGADSGPGIDGKLALARLRAKYVAMSKG